MKKILVAVSFAVFSVAVHAQFLQDLPGASVSTGETLKVTSKFMMANRQTGEMCASGGVTAVSHPYRFYAEKISRDKDGLYDFGEDSMLTTCTNDVDDLHWKIVGSFKYKDQRYVSLKNVWVYLYDVPVLWLPYWYYPMNTDYGLRLIPGYRSRWGGYLLSGYVYNIYNEHDPNGYSLGGSTYLDYRTKNGFGVGQSLRWNLKELGRGKIKGNYFWDEDYDRYTRHWDDGEYNHSNWGSNIERERYRISLEHSADLTERDNLRVKATYLSDSHVLYDFFRRDEDRESIPVNEIWYEHRENDFALGGSVSGPINDFYGGTARLPEGWLSIMPQPIWDLPVNYESQTRAGYLNRDYAKTASSDDMFRYNPYLGVNGRGADYQAFRADTSHRLTYPFKVWDVLSVVPRATYRGTYWSDSGDVKSSYTTASEDAIYRNIVEVGFTMSARGTTWIDDSWRHTVEPYLDYSFQKVNLTSASGKRYYSFDNYDRSTDWLDQFGFEGRGLPYNWHGIRPGIRNFFQQRDEQGILRTVADIDVYAAVPFDTESCFKDGVLAGYPKDDEDGTYNANGKSQCIPGTRIRLNPWRDISFSTRTEYDCHNSKVGYSDIMFRHRLSNDFSYYLSYIGRDHRIWDYLPSNYDRWNYELSNVISLGFTHNVCDWFAWSPFIRYDCRCNDVERVGAWFDLLTDCLGFRISVSHESAYTRVDYSKEDADNTIMFYIYIRSLGPSTMFDMAQF